MSTIRTERYSPYTDADSSTSSVEDEEEVLYGPAGTSYRNRYGNINEAMEQLPSEQHGHKPPPPPRKRSVLIRKFALHRQDTMPRANGNRRKNQPEPFLVNCKPSLRQVEQGDDAPMPPKYRI